MSGRRVGEVILEIQRLGPLEDLRVRLAPLTVLVSPRGRESTYILGALFSELLPADPSLVGACFSITSDELVWALQALHENEVLRFIIDNFTYNSEKKTLRIKTFGLCFNLDGARRKVERCLGRTLIPRGSRFRLRIDGQPRIIEEAFRLVKRAFERSGFTIRRSMARGREACIIVNNVVLPVSMMSGTPEGSQLLSLLLLLPVTGPRELEQSKLRLALALISEGVARHSQELQLVRRALETLYRELRGAWSALSRYKPVYAQFWRGVNALIPIESWMSYADSLRYGLGDPLPRYSMARAVSRGLTIADPSREPRELALLTELVTPIFSSGTIPRNRRPNSGTNAVQALLNGSMHKRPVGIATLLMAASSLLGRGGFLLVEEVDHTIPVEARWVQPLILLALSGAGLNVVATTNSVQSIIIIWSLLTVVHKQGGTRAVIGKARQLYEAAGLRPPSREALELVAQGAVRGVDIYLVDNSLVKLEEDIMGWLDRWSSSVIGSVRQLLTPLLPILENETILKELGITRDPEGEASSV